MSDEAVRSLSRLQKEILQYLLKHPDAKDTAEGIQHWWLPQSGKTFQSADWGSALNGLVTRGWLTASSCGQSVVYGLQQAKCDEIARSLGN